MCKYGCITNLWIGFFIFPCSQLILCLLKKLFRKLSSHDSPWYDQKRSILQILLNLPTKFSILEVIEQVPSPYGLSRSIIEIAGSFFRCKTLWRRVYHCWPHPSAIRNGKYGNIKEVSEAMMAEYRKGEIRDALYQTLIKSLLCSANLGDLVSRWNLIVFDEAHPFLRKVDDNLWVCFLRSASTGIFCCHATIVRASFRSSPPPRSGQFSDGDHVTDAPNQSVFVPFGLS